MKALFLLPLLALLASTASACADHELPDAGSSVQDVETSVSTSKNEGALLVTVIGTLKNTTGDRIENPVLEAKLTDAKGKVIDVLGERTYGLVVPAGQEVAFRLQGPAAAGANSYSSAQVRVVTAEAHAPSSPYPTRKEAKPVFDLLLSWSPMLLLVAVWIFLARKYNGRGSTQDKMLAAINEQNALFAKQIAAIEGIAAGANVKRSLSDD